MVRTAIERFRKSSSHLTAIHSDLIQVYIKFYRGSTLSLQVVMMATLESIIYFI